MPAIYHTGECIDHYEIIKPLGQGGSSHVYLALDQTTQQEVVLKFPHIDEIGSADVYARYQREKKIGRRLNHPHIQKHLNQEETRSDDYLVLDYLRGQTLREAMHECMPELLPVDRAVQIAAWSAETLVYVHEQGIIHRDLKPENVFLLENGEVVLFDFGIAQWKDERFLRWRGFRTPIGTPAYMAPELLWGKSGLIQSDIYGLGAVLYELLSGQTPFGEHNGFAFLSEHISHDPPNILIHNPTLTPALATVVMRCIRRDPQKRYPTMQALADDLRHLDKVQPIVYTPSAPKLGGRYRQALRITLIVMLVLAAVIAFGFFLQAIHPATR
jgi:serine/threonine-protein kinase